MLQPIQGKVTELLSPKKENQHYGVFFIYHIFLQDFFTFSVVFLNERNFFFLTFYEKPFHSVEVAFLRHNKYWF